MTVKTQITVHRRIRTLNAHQIFYSLKG